MNDNLSIYFLNYSLDLNKKIIKKNLIIEKEINLKNNNENLNYILLKKPIFNPIYIDKIKFIVENICYTHFILYNDNKVCNVLDCKNKHKKFKIDIINKEVVFIDNDMKIYTAKDILKLLQKINNHVIKSLGFLHFKDINYRTSPVDLIMEYIPVIPKYIRPSSTINSLETDDILNYYYKKIINYNNNNDFINVYETYKNLIIKNNDNDKYKSILQRISSKKGLFRNNILGKRTRLCGRSVISPDIFLKIDEIGIPYEMVNKLMIKNRNIRNNDYVLFIRHPTLQKMSVMGMRVKIQKETFTIRMNPSLCPAYNADFDGDEMNIFCVSDYPSISESTYLCSPNNNIISSQNNKAIIYPSHDCLSGIYILTYKNIKIKKNIFFNCLSVIKKYIKHKKYSDIKFDGRNLFSLCLPDDLYFYNKDVIIEKGILLNGYIDKNMFLKIIEYMSYNYEKYIILDLIYYLQLIINEWLKDINLSIGYEDCYIPLIYKNSKLIVNNNLSLIINNNNIFNHIIKSGCKGSYINLRQITLFIGQQYIKNKKITELPFLSNNDTFCYSSYTDGLDVYEYFYHCQSAREGIISTNIKTPKVGYMQRKLTKFLENIFIQYNKYTIYNNYVL